MISYYPLTQSFAIVKFALLNSNLSTSLTAPLTLSTATYPSGFVTLNPSGVLIKWPIACIWFNFLIKKRLDVYQKETEPLLNYYKDNIINIKAEGDTPENIAKNILEKIKWFLSKLLDF